MAPMAIDESFTESMNSYGNRSEEIEDVVVVGAGPAGLMLAYVCNGIQTCNCRLTRWTQVNTGALWHQVKGVGRPTGQDRYWKSRWPAAKDHRNLQAIEARGWSASKRRQGLRHLLLGT